MFSVLQRDMLLVTSSQCKDLGFDSSESYFHLLAICTRIQMVHLSLKLSVFAFFLGHDIQFLIRTGGFDRGPRTEPTKKFDLHLY